MIWQDAVLTSGSLVFISALVPMLLHRAKPPLLTSIPTGVVLLAFAATYLSLGFPVAAATSAVAALIWLALAAQRIYNRTEVPSHEAPS